MATDSGFFPTEHGTGCQPRRISVGSRVQLGSYPQSSDTPEPITWRVLGITDGRALMISEALLDCRRYNETPEKVTWETCTLRKWLNGDFFDKAFSAGEQRMIAAVSNRNPDNPSFGTEGGRQTEDRVFCLSIDEAERYFDGDSDRRARLTAYAEKNGAEADAGNGMGWWWLRSPGSGGRLAASVYDCGYIIDNGDLVDYDGGSVRPAVCVSLQAGA